jgi:hypothetical protein
VRGGRGGCEAHLGGEVLAGEAGGDAGDAAGDAGGRVAGEGHAEGGDAVDVAQHGGEASAGELGEGGVEEGVVRELLEGVGAEERRVARVVDAVVRADGGEEVLPVQLEVGQQLRGPRRHPAAAARRFGGRGSGAAP